MILVDLGIAHFAFIMAKPMDVDDIISDVVSAWVATIPELESDTETSKLQNEIRAYLSKGTKGLEAT